jgi:hypothetical protein
VPSLWGLLGHLGRGRPGRAFQDGGLCIQIGGSALLCRVEAHFVPMFFLFTGGFLGRGQVYSCVGEVILAFFPLFTGGVA